MDFTLPFDTSIRSVATRQTDNVFTSVLDRQPPCSRRFARFVLLWMAVRETGSPQIIDRNSNPTDCEFTTRSLLGLL